MPDTTGTVDEDGAVGGGGMPEATMASGAGSCGTTAASTSVSEESTPGAGSSTPSAGTTGSSAGVPVGE